jgi:hypothetical protein
MFQIREACQDLILDDKTLREIMSRFLQEIEKGLKKETHPKADVKCFVTYVQDLPNGKGESARIHKHHDPMLNKMTFRTWKISRFGSWRNKFPRFADSSQGPK